MTKWGAPVHGTPSCYHSGCRRPECREAYRLYYKRWREGRLAPGMLPSLGVARRLQALSAIGWALSDLTMETGFSNSKTHLSRMRKPLYATVTRVTHDRVAEVYDRLCMTRGTSTRSALYANRQGWAPPLAWDDIDDPNCEPSRGEPNDTGLDMVAVERALTGVPVALTPREKTAAVNLGLDRRMTPRSITDRVHVHVRQIDRVVAKRKREAS